MVQHIYIKDGTGTLIKILEDNVKFWGRFGHQSDGPRYSSPLFWFSTWETAISSGDRPMTLCHVWVGALSSRVSR